MRGYAGLILWTVLSFPAAAAGSSPPPPPDSLLVLEPVVVIADRPAFGAATVICDRADLTRALEQLGLISVHRGGTLAGDLYAGGFKRAEVGLVVDGERYHCACPNRMDPPTSLALPTEIESATWDRGSAAIGAGLGGQIRMTRSRPGDRFGLTGSVTGAGGRSDEMNATLALEARRHRIAGRWTGGHSGEDGAGVSFGRRYGYRAADVYSTQGDLSFRGETGGLNYALQGSRTNDVPYPYLQMDERENELWGGSVKPWKHRLYFNHTRHVMDNGLRTSSTTMPMRTDARQTTVGITGPVGSLACEAYYRDWDAENTIGAGAMALRNHMIPGFRQISASLSQTWEAGAWRLDARAGAARMQIRDGAAVARYPATADGPVDGRWFLPFAGGVSRQVRLASDLTTGFSLDVTSATPTAEELFIVVQRPQPAAGPPRPNWFGNTRLAAPVRLSLRNVTQVAGLRVECQASRVWSTVMPVALMLDGRPYKSYAGVDATVVDIGVSGAGRFVDARLGATYGWNLKTDGPLAEMSPLSARVLARTPELGSFRAEALVEGATAQRRVDASQSERATESWARLDLGLVGRLSATNLVRLEVVNVTDAFYSRHLSYLRDPFASGISVTEPGRSILLTLTTSLPGAD